jgi:formylglycine-generating enzyme required for sulfatase activity
MTVGAPEKLDVAVWRDLLDSDAKARREACRALRDSGQQEEYAAALVGIVESEREPFAYRRAAGDALGLLGDPRINTKDPAMVRVPAGPFQMGTRTEDAPRIIKEYSFARVKKRFLAKEMPAHEVETREFEIGKYPVTNQEYAEFVAATEREKPPSWTASSYPEDKANHPVVRISHEDAVAYTAWLSRETGRRYRLATEAEWEKAARGTDGRIYPWGNQFDPDRCNTIEGNAYATLYKKARPLFKIYIRVGGAIMDTGLLPDRFDTAINTTPVGIYPHGASPYGALDMAGNAEEWVADKFALYAGYPFGDEFDWSAESWVCRGGAWNRPGDVSRTARRHGNFIGTGSIGLRLARDVGD